jgi:hypothetical protein
MPAAILQREVEKDLAFALRALQDNQRVKAYLNTIVALTRLGRLLTPDEHDRAVDAARFNEHSSTVGEVRTAGACDCDPLSNTGGGHSVTCPEYEPECTCYEMTGGHQPMCPYGVMLQQRRIKAVSYETRGKGIPCEVARIFRDSDDQELCGAAAVERINGIPMCEFHLDEWDTAGEIEKREPLGDG